MIKQELICTILITLSAISFGVFAQDAITFEDAVVSQPSQSRYKSAAGGNRLIRLSALGIKVSAPITIPVLLPNDEALLRTTTIFSDSASYSAVLRKTDFTINVLGTKTVAAVGIASENSSPSNQIRLEKTEYGYQASLKEFGVSYMVIIECQKKSDVRCTKPTYVYQLAKSLEVYAE